MVDKRQIRKRGRGGKRGSVGKRQGRKKGRMEREAG